MPADSLDPVPSPEPVADSSSAPQTAPAATPEPSGGVPTTPPVVSDKASVSAPAKPAIPADPSKGVSPVTPDVKPLGEGDVLDRLTPPTAKTTEPATPEVAVETPTSGDTENKEAPVESEEDAPFTPADEKELAGYHSRTRKRLGQYHKELARQKPYVEFAENLVTAAAQNNLTVPAILNWQKLGFGIRAGDPEALEALESVLDSHGRTAQQAAPDLAPLEAVIAKLHRSLNLDDEGKAELEAALGGMKKAPAPQPPPPQPQRQAAPQQQAPHPLAQTASWVQSQEAQLAQTHGQKWPDLKKAIYAEAARREQALPAHLVNDPIELRVRFAACKEYVLAKAVAPKLPSVQPSLRAITAPTPITAPKRGTAEYDDFVMTHGVPPK